MKNKPSFDNFIRLARRGANEAPLEPPPGFAARVAARWKDEPGQIALLALWERAASWAAATTLAICLFAAWVCRADFDPAVRAGDSFAAFVDLNEDSEDTP